MAIGIGEVAGTIVEQTNFLTKTLDDSARKASIDPVEHTCRGTAAKHTRRRMEDMELRSIQSVANELGVDRRVVTYVVNYHNIQTRKVPMNGSVRGLDPAAVRKVAKLVKAGLKPKAASA